MKDTVGAEAKEICHLEPAEYPVEFADPAVVRGLISNVDFTRRTIVFAPCFSIYFLDNTHTTVGF